ncbi:hypothetical protein ACHAPJ_007122 [Fusarium lateritium]
MSGPDVAGLAIATTQLCCALAKGLYSIIQEVRSASEDARQVQDSLVTLHQRLYQVQCLFERNVPQDPLEQDYRNSIFGVLEAINKDLDTLRNKLRLDVILAAKGSRKQTTWVVVQRMFEEADIREVKARLGRSEEVLQSHFMILSLFLCWKTRDDVAELTSTIRPVLARLFQDAKATEQRQRSETASLLSSRTIHQGSAGNDTDVDTVLGSESDRDYQGAVDMWQHQFEDMIKSVKDLSLHETPRPKFVPSVLNQDFDDRVGSDIPNSVEDSEVHSSQTPQPSPTTSTTDAAPEDINEGTDGVDPRDWCKSQGFEVDKPGFRYDVSDDAAPDVLKGVSPIHQAIKKGETSVLGQMLSSPGYNVDVRLRSKHDDATPLLLACSERKAEAVELLLSKQARIDTRDCTDQTGLHLCQSSSPGGIEVARVLIEHKNPWPSKLSVNATDKYKTTAAHLAARVGDAEMVEYLVGKGADPNSQQLDGSTPLMVALKYTMDYAKIKRIIDILVKHNANLALKNKQNENAVLVAQRYSERSVIKYLQAQMRLMNSDRGSSRRTSEQDCGVQAHRAKFSILTGFHRGTRMVGFS